MKANKFVVLRCTSVFLSNVVTVLVISGNTLVFTFELN